MIVPYTPMPFGAPPRPLLDVEISGSGAKVKALVDSGAVNTLFHGWVADDAGIDLSGADVRSLAVGGGRVEARFVKVRLAAAGHTWEAEVGFSDSWQANFGLLGHSAFFRYFTILFRAADLEFEVEPVSA